MGFTRANVPCGNFAAHGSKSPQESKHSVLSLENAGNSDHGEKSAANLGADSPDLAKIIAAWPSLNERGRAAVLAALRGAAPVGAENR